MFNFLDKIKETPAFYKQIAIDRQLVTEYNCPLEERLVGIWTEQSYFLYVIEGKKVWHTPGGSHELTEGKCVFVKKGAHVVEQFFDARFCNVIFFVSDRFIADTMRSGFTPDSVVKESKSDAIVVPVHADDTLHAFFNSVVPYFLNNGEANKALLELKFKELILNVAGNPDNQVVKDYFYSLITDSHAESMRKIMEDNFLYNLNLEAFAKMCGRSVSAFKRDFVNHFNTTPGRWLLERRLQHSQILLRTSGSSISEIAFDCGFENASHFSRAFKQQFGDSPARYRAKLA